MDERITRRVALRALGLTAAGLAVYPPMRHLAAATTATPAASKARLSSRPHAPRKSIAPGTSPLGLGKAGRDGKLQVPTSYTQKVPAPLIVMLHGAGESADEILAMNGIGAIANNLGAIVLAPDSRDVTWDMMHGDFGPDIDFIDHALAYTFDCCNVDPSRISLAGFSDGASYALSIGLANGDLFNRIIAFSPGFIETPERVGKPRIFVSHGTRDRILPIDSASRRIVPQLKTMGYDVEYNEFDGPHTPHADMVRRAFAEVTVSSASR
jgi:phospholipase/carboxylesterase